MPTGYAQTTRRAPSRPLGLAPQQYTAQIVIDRQTIGLVGQEGNIAAGQAAVALNPPAGGQGYLIERIDLWSASGVPTTASCYVGSASPQNEVDFSASANHDIADEHQPIFVPSEQTFSIIWSGLAAGGGAEVTARVQYSVIQFVQVNLPGGGPGPT